MLQPEWREQGGELIQVFKEHFGVEEGRHIRSSILPEAGRWS